MAETLISAPQSLCWIAILLGLLAWWWCLPLALGKYDYSSVGTGIKVLHTPDEQDEIEIDVVAVNGLQAHPEWTWKSKSGVRTPFGWLWRLLPSSLRRTTRSEKPVDWLQSLLPKSLPHARILCFRQDSSYLINAPDKNIRDCAEQLLGALKSVREGKAESNRPILFIGHSFGGIVIKQAVVLAARSSSCNVDLNSTRILFLGTPHNGSALSSFGMVIVRLAYFMGSSPSIMAALGWHSRVLFDLSKDFSAVYKQQTISICETRRSFLCGIFPFFIVDQRSGSIDGHESLVLDTDHSGLNKYHASDSRYGVVEEAIKALTSGTVSGHGKTEFLESLNPFSLEATLQDHYRQPLKNTCDWIEGHLEKCLKSCSEPESSKGLIILGGPGTGKSVLSQFILDYLEAGKPGKSTQATQATQYNPRVAYYIFKSTNEEGSKAHVALRTLIHQLLRDDNDGDKLYCIARGFFPKGDKKGISSQLNNIDFLWDVFGHIMDGARSRPTLILIDGLDECHPESREQLTNKFRAKPDLHRHFIVTSQQFMPLGRLFPTWRHIYTDSEMGVTEGIAVLVDDHVKRLAENRGFKPPIQEELRQTLKAKAGNMYLWVRISYTRIDGLAHSSPRYIREELDTWPQDLVFLYVDMFRRTLKDHERTVKRRLPWLLYASQPLTVDELDVALATQDCLDHQETDLDQWRASNLETDLNRTFGALLRFDKSSAKTLVRFCHDSVKDVLLGSPPNAELTGICRSTEVEHATIAATCLAYLSFLSFDGPLPPESEGQPTKLFAKYPFLEYAALRWPYHAREARRGNNAADISSLVDHFRVLARKERNMEVAFELYMRSGPYRSECYIPLLQKVLWMELEWLAILLLESGENLHEATESGEHIVHDAAGCGAMDFLKRVLHEDGVRIDVRDQYNQTGLHYAVQDGREEMVRFLVQEHRIPVNDHGRQGLTPLHTALLNAPQKTLQHHASDKRHLEIARFLMKHGAWASINCKDDDERTPLHLAATKGHSDIVRELLDEGAIVNERDNDGRTPLYYAILCKHDGVVETLRHYGAEV